MTELVYRGVRYTREDKRAEPVGEMPVLRYRGVEFDPREAWHANRPIYTGRFAKVYRGVSDDDGPGGNAPALAFG